MNVGSLFSGIGGLDEGLRRAGHRHLFLCESDAYRRDVLRARFPGVPVYDDVRVVANGLADSRTDRSDPSSGEIREQGRNGWTAGIDLLCGGFPCQDLSVAGRRAGLAGNRSGLFFEFARIIESVRPGWLLIENVPGLLSSNGGRDFGVVLAALADLGYGVAWRILDSRFFGVPQRRRRVFIVGAFAGGDPRVAADRAGAVLAVGQGCERHLAARGEARPVAARSSNGGVGGGSEGGDVSHVLTNPSKGRAPDTTEYVVAAPLTKGSATGEGVNKLGRRQEDDVSIVAFQPSGGGGGAMGGTDAPTLKRQGGSGYPMPAIAGDSVGVRRLTPTECERLQGFPDGWTQLGETPDSRRYSALGDAVTVNVSEWIGHRIARETA